MKASLLVFFGLFLNLSSAQGVMDSLARVISNDICSCVEEIDTNNRSQINEKGIQCTNYVILTHLDTSFFNPKSNEEKVEYTNLMGRIGIYMNECERITLLKKLAEEKKNTTPVIPREIFIDKEFLEIFELKIDKELSSSNMLVYNGPQNKERIQRFTDIRLLFQTSGEAVQYYNENLNDLSENGKEIQLPVVVRGVYHLKAFEESDKKRFELDEMKLNAKQYSIIFVKKNILVKLFFGTPKEYGTMNLIPFIEKARDLIR